MTSIGIDQNLKKLLTADTCFQVMNVFAEDPDAFTRAFSRMLSSFQLHHSSETQLDNWDVSIADPLTDFHEWLAGLNVTLGVCMAKCRSRLLGRNPAFCAWALAALQRIPREPPFNESRIEFILLCMNHLESGLFGLKEISIWMFRLKVELAMAELNRLDYADPNASEISISLLEGAVKGFESLEMTQDLAITEMYLGCTYSVRATGKLRMNQERAIQHFETALDLFRKVKNSAWRARVYLGLSSVYSDRLTGDRRENMETSLRYLNRALRIFRRERFPLEWASVKRRLGQVRCRLSRLTSQRGDSHILRHFNEALDALPPDVYRSERIGTLISKAHFFMIRDVADRSRSIEKAITVLNTASRLVDLRIQPQLFLSINLNLAAAYGRRIAGDREENIERVIACLKSAEQCQVLKLSGKRYAKHQVNLGLTYLMKVSGDPSANREDALLHLTTALGLIEKDADPMLAARIHLNLSRIFLYRTHGVSPDNIERSILHANKALETITIDVDREQWGTIICNLAMAFMRRSIGKKSRNLDAALRKLEDAERVIDQHTFPDLWATIRNYRGKVLLEQTGGGDRECILKQALVCFESAQDVHSRVNFPLYWAELELEKAQVYYELSSLTNTLMTTEITACCRNAVENFPLVTFPEERFSAFELLGDCRMLASHWQPAIEAYERADECCRWLQRQALIRPTIENNLKRAAGMHSKAAYCYAQLNDFDTAVRCLEYGKANLLKLSLRRNQSLYSQLEPEDRRQYESILDEINILESKQREISSTSRSGVDLIRRSRRLKTNFDQLTARIRRYLPGFLDEPELEVDDIERKLTPDDILLIYNVTKYGGVILSVNKTDCGTQKQVTFNRSLNTENVSRLVHDWRVVFGGVGETLDSVPDSNAMHTVLKELYGLLILPINDELRQLKKKRLFIVPHSLLAIFPLHLICSSNSPSSDYLIDEYEVILQPGLGLWVDDVSDRPNKPTNILAISNPTGDLPGAKQEIHLLDKIAQGRISILEGAECTYDSIIRSINDQPLIHFASHAGYHPEDPFKAYLMLAPDKTSVDDAEEIETSDDISELTPVTVTGAMRVNRAGRWILLDSSRKSLCRLATLEEIMRDVRLKRNAMVVLSACESGVIDQEHLPDEFISLASGFIACGAGCVISSLWKVDDLATCRLMTMLYVNVIKRGMAPSEALRNAQIRLRKQPRFRSPFYWGGFQLTGNNQIFCNSLL